MKRMKKKTRVNQSFEIEKEALFKELSDNKYRSRVIPKGKLYNRKKLKQELIRELDED